MESLLSVEGKDSSSRRLTSNFTKISINPQGQLCMWLNRPIVFSECLVQVAEMGSKYGHSVLSPALGASHNADEAIFLINDSALLRHMVSEGNGSGQSSAEPDPNDINLSDGRTALLVGVFSNLLKARGHTVDHHHGNWPRSTSSRVSGSNMHA